MKKLRGAAKRIYNRIKDLPIVDYHCHLSVAELIENKRFKDITEVLLAHDHYKWRLMRTFGVDEEYITGNKDGKEKFIKLVEALSSAIGSPVYDWTAAELKKYFGIREKLLIKNAERIFESANEYIEKENLTPLKAIESSNVKCIGIIEDAFADAGRYEELKRVTKVKITPSFRGDRILDIGGAVFLENLVKLESVTGVKVRDLDSLKKAVCLQLDSFKKAGCFTADFALQDCGYKFCNQEKAEEIFSKRLDGRELNAEEHNAYLWHMLKFMAEESYKRDFAVQLHIGAVRNINFAAYRALGPDSGYDAIASSTKIDGLSGLFNDIGNSGRTIVFSLNPNDNDIIVSTLGAFQDGGVKGKMQLGAAWWFNDHQDGIIKHLKAYCSGSVLGTFIGMLTDSRSFVSYSRHDYFRKILSGFLAELTAGGNYGGESAAYGIAADISYFNAADYFKL